MKKALSVFLSLLLCCSFVTFAFAGDDDFEIEDGVLIRYNGDDDKVVVPEGVKTLNNDSLADKKMTEVVLPDSLEVIEGYAMCWCENLKTVTIPKNVNEIGDCALEGCTSLSSVKVAGENRHFKAVDGVLFDKAGERLLAYPSAKTGTTFSGGRKLMSFFRRARLSMGLLR